MRIAEGHRQRSAVLALCAIAIAVLVAGIVAAAPGESAVGVATRALGALLPLTLSLYRLRRHDDDRLALLLAGAAALWSLTTLAQSGDDVLYSTGRTAAWISEAAIIYLLLAFPRGEVARGTPRRLMAAIVALLVFLYLPTILLAPFPDPSPYSGCGPGCPDNAFALGDGHSAFVDDVIRPLREGLTVLLYALVAIWLTRRTVRAAPLLRSALVPVAVIAVLRTLTVAVYDTARVTDGARTLAEAAGWLYVLSLPGLTVAFALGLLSQRLFFADALKRLTVSLSSHPDAAELRAAMAEALQDRSLRVAFRTGGERGGWVDEHGASVEPPSSRNGFETAMTEAGANGRRVAVIAEDVGLSHDPAFLRAATAYTLATIENDRLADRLHASVRELARSRTRIVTAAARERQKIERDLHDGAQQHLVALRIKLELAAVKLEAESPDAAATLRALEADVDAAMEEVRSFARGLYPSLLAQRGIGEALRSATRTDSLPARVTLERLGRYPPEVEATVYFACIEALQNAAKHAPGSNVTIAVADDDGALRFEIADDGPGFDAADAAPGAGLVNMSDRLAAVGGRLDVRSSPGGGTRVVGSIPSSPREG